MAPAGRPKIGKEKRRRVNLMLDPNTYDYLKLVGDGSASNGLYLIVIHSMAARIHEEVKKLPKPKAKAKKRGHNQGADRG